MVRTIPLVESMPMARNDRPMDPASYSSAFRSWNSRASLFAGTWLRDQDRFEGSAYWTRAHTVLGLAADLDAIPEPSRWMVEVGDFLLYNAFTLALEDGPVDRVCRSIANGQLLPWATDAMREDARRIVLDESFHGLFTAQLSVSVQHRTGFHVPRLRSSLGLRLAAAIDKVEPCHRSLAELLFVTCSETLVTSTLGELGNEVTLHPAIRSAIRDHARDEGRHRAFFKSCGQELWLRLTERERDLAASLVPRLLHVYLAPDVAAIATVLAGLPGITDVRRCTAEVVESVAHHASCLRAARHSADMFRALDPRRFDLVEVELERLLE